MTTKAELLQQITEINPDVGLSLKKAKKEELEQWLSELEPEGDYTAAQKMAAALRKARERYTKVKSATGKDSMDNNDLVAKLLRERTPAEVIAAAEKLLELSCGELATKYENLNPGQKRMNAGNRIRGAISRGDITEEECVETLA